MSYKPYANSAHINWPDNFLEALGMRLKFSRSRFDPRLKYGMFGSIKHTLPEAKVYTGQVILRP